MENEKVIQATKIVEDMNKDLDMSRIEELIKNNRIAFDYDGKQYRVCLLNLRQKEELDLLRRRKFGQLIKDKDLLFEKDLIIQYKERGIDIDEFDEQLKKLSSEESDLQLKLGEAISKNEAEAILKTYKEQIEELQIKKQIINTQKNLLLEFSIENSLLNYVAQVITYLSLESLIDDKWQRTFATLEEFQNFPDEKFINKAASYSMCLQYL